MAANPFEEILSELSEIRADIRKLKQPAETTPQPEPDKIFIDEVERITGLKRGTIYKGTSTGEIPHKRQGKILIFSRKEINNFLESKVYSKPDHKQKAAQQLADSAAKKLERATA
jgi:predicted DNA-binding transcriptional regulator AlpA